VIVVIEKIRLETYLKEVGHFLFLKIESLKFSVITAMENRWL
jgi:hypothetical protein